VFFAMIYAACQFGPSAGAAKAHKGSACALATTAAAAGGFADSPLISSHTLARVWTQQCGSARVPNRYRPRTAEVAALQLRTCCLNPAPRALKRKIMTGTRPSSVLVSAAAVCGAHDGLAGLSHVATVISSFLDASPCWSLQRAVAAGHMALLRRLLESGKKMPPHDVERAVERAAEAGLLQALQLLHEHFPERPDSWVIDVAASRGRLDVVVWLHANSTADRATMFAMDEAAANGHLAVVQWLHANRTEGCTTRALDCAARSGHLDVVQWLHTNRIEGCTSQAMDWAAAGGHLEVVQWLHANRREGCSSMAIDGAASNGHLRVAYWLHTHKQLRCTSNALRAATSRGHHEVLNWLTNTQGDPSGASSVVLATAI
jgi:hypothetical protein